jgi:hypothetical protein
VSLWVDSVEKVGLSTGPNLFSAAGAVFKCSRGSGLQGRLRMTYMGKIGKLRQCLI